MLRRIAVLAAPIAGRNYRLAFVAYRWWEEEESGVGGSRWTEDPGATPVPVEADKHWTASFYKVAKDGKWEPYFEEGKTGAFRVALWPLEEWETWDAEFNGDTHFVALCHREFDRIAGELTPANLRPAPADAAGTDSAPEGAPE